MREAREGVRRVPGFPLQGRASGARGCPGAPVSEETDTVDPREGRPGEELVTGVGTPGRLRLGWYSQLPF